MTTFALCSTFYSFSGHGDRKKRNARKRSPGDVMVQLDNLFLEPQILVHHRSKIQSGSFHNIKIYMPNTKSRFYAEKVRQAADLSVMIILRVNQQLYQLLALINCIVLVANYLSKTVLANRYR